MNVNKIPINYMLVFMAIWLLLPSCTNTIATIPNITIPKPIIMQIKPEFKEVKIIHQRETLVLDKENSQNLIYNIKMSRIYFNQCKLNLKLTQDYYDQVVRNLYGKDIVNYV